MNLKRCLVFVALLLSCFSGCETSNLPKTVPAEGVITLDGEKVSEATILLIADKGSINADAVSDKDGKFKLKAFAEKGGAVPGSYRVLISKTINEAGVGKNGESGVNLKYGLPKKYSDVMTSGLTYTLGQDGDKNMKFDLVTK